MQIKCDKCQAVYSIAENVIGANGRKVKCAKCGYVWQVNLPQSEEPFKLVPTIAEHHLTWMLKLLSIALLAFIFYVGYLSFPSISNDLSAIRNLYSKPSSNTEGVILEDVKYKIIDDNLIISGKFINNSDDDKSLPSIGYSILNEEREVIFSETQDFPDKQLSPEKTYQINAKITNLDPNAAYLQLDIGDQPDSIKKYNLHQEE